MFNKAALALVSVAMCLSAHSAMAMNLRSFSGGHFLNPQPLPPGRRFMPRFEMLNPQPLPPGYRFELNPQPLPPGRYRLSEIEVWRCHGVQVGDPRTQPPERVCG